MAQTDIINAMYDQLKELKDGILDDMYDLLDSRKDKLNVTAQEVPYLKDAYQIDELRIGEGEFGNDSIWVYIDRECVEEITDHLSADQMIDVYEHLQSFFNKAKNEKS